MRIKPKSIILLGLLLLAIVALHSVGWTDIHLASRGSSDRGPAFPGDPDGGDHGDPVDHQHQGHPRHPLHQIGGMGNDQAALGGPGPGPFQDLAQVLPGKERGNFPGVRHHGFLGNQDEDFPGHQDEDFPENQEEMSQGKDEYAIPAQGLPDSFGKSLVAMEYKAKELIQALQEQGIQEEDQDAQSMYNDFLRQGSDEWFARLLEKSQLGSDEHEISSLLQLARIVEKAGLAWTPPAWIRPTPEMLDVLRQAVTSTPRGPKRTKGRSVNMYTNETDLPSHKVFHNRINQFELYDGDDPNVDDVLRDLRTQPFRDMYQMTERGTQLKLVFYLENHGRAIFKPMRFPRRQEVLPNHYYFSDFERHVAEIASFYLDRVLGFHRVPPCTGRWFNLTSDIRDYADKDLEKTFFYSPVGNLCFYGECTYYCDSGHPVCGQPDMAEGSLALFLPNKDIVKRTRWRHPWRRSYSKKKQADWENDPDYCAKVKRRKPYDMGRRLLDLMDMAVFDFFTGNQDRHHYETFTMFDNFTFTLHLDNGRGFGRSYHDDMSILAPIMHCCMMRHSTMRKLLDYNSAPPTRRLSSLMREEMRVDPVRPVVLEPHLEALDRRVDIILDVVYKCIAQKGGRSVIIDDGF